MLVRTVFYLLLLCYCSNTAEGKSRLPSRDSSELSQHTIALPPDSYLFISGQTATLFIGGGAFNGKEKPQKANKNFTQNLIQNLKVGLAPPERYRTSKRSKRFLGIIRNSIYSLKFGAASVPAHRLSRKNKHKALRKTITESYLFSNFCVSSNPPTLNIIGSSYGSVIAAQIAVELIEKEGGTVNSLILTASPIDQSSDLGTKLMNMKNNDKIGEIFWYPNMNDNITGASGNRGVWKLIFPPQSSGNKSILNPNHPHNRAMKDLSRVQTILQFFNSNNLINRL